jgi:hypothetical protein
MTQLPPSLHTSVNSERSNQRIDVMAMSDALEPWSHPWHALQRTLAKAFGADAASYSTAAGARSPGAAFRAAEAASWLVRARSAAASPAVFPTPR